MISEEVLMLDFLISLAFGIALWLMYSSAFNAMFGTTRPPSGR